MMQLLLALVSSLALAAPAFAEVAPGPPSSCHVAAACDARGCAPLPGMLASVHVEVVGGSFDTLRLHGRTVGRYATREAAQAVVATGAIPLDANLLLVRDAHDPADAIGFASYAPSSRGSKSGLSDTYASLICT